jgi:hypothetical protein
MARAPPLSGSDNQGAADGAAQDIEIWHGRYCISKIFVSKLLNWKLLPGRDSLQAECDNGSTVGGLGSERRVHGH